MEKNSDMDNAKKNPCEFYQSLPKADLRQFLNNPLFLEEVLECAAESEVLTQAIDEILEDEYQELAYEEQARIDCPLATVDPRMGVASQLDATVEIRSKVRHLLAWRHVQREQPLRMAAGQEQEPGWPFRLELESKIAADPICLELKWEGFALVVEYPAAADAPELFLSLEGRGKEITLSASNTVTLGPLSDFRLSSKSTTEQISRALKAAGFTARVSAEGS